MNELAFGFAWLGFVPMGFAILWASNLLHAGRRDAPGGKSAAFLTLLGALLILAGIAGPLLLMGNIGGFVIGVLAMASCVFAIAEFRRQETRALYGQIDRAIQNGLPIEPLVARFSQQHNHELGRRAERLNHLIKQGMPLLPALKSSGFPLAPDVALAVGIGTSSSVSPRRGHDATPNPVPSPEVANDARSNLDRRTLLEWQPARFSHIPICLQIMISWLAVLLVSSFFCVKILPTLPSIVQDFGLPLQVPFPGFGQFEFSQLIAGLFLALVLLFLAVLVVLLYYMRWISWEPPGIRRLLCQRHEARILRYLALDIAAARPVVANLGELSRIYPSRHIRRRLTRAIAQLNQGQRWLQALKAPGLISSATFRVLDSAERVGNLNWALRFMADQALDRWQAREQLAAQILLPVAVVVGAAPILLIGWFVFANMASLVMSLS